MLTKKVIGGAITVLLLTIVGSLVLAKTSIDSATKRTEQSFIRDMVAHHEAAIVLAQAAKADARRNDLRLTAAGIITSHQQDLETMKTYYKAWYGVAVPKSKLSPRTGLAPPSNSATTNDGFASMMTAHQEKGLALARAAIPKIRHEDLKILAYTMIDRFSSEINQLKLSLSSATTQVSGPESIIAYTDKGFDQKELMVASGTTVTFVNQRNGRPMWVASNIHPTHTIYPEFDQGRVLGYEPLPKDNSFSFTFTKPGRWIYHDHYDPAQLGVVTVD